jgi:hypothetical protein
VDVLDSCTRLTLGFVRSSMARQERRDGPVHRAPHTFLRREHSKKEIFGCGSGDGIYGSRRGLLAVCGDVWRRQGRDYAVRGGSISDPITDYKIALEE